MTAMTSCMILLAGCSKAADRTINHVVATDEPRQLQALRAIIGAKPVQWISPRELCAVPFDARNDAACAARQAVTIPADRYRTIRAIIPVPTSELSFVRCARVSREIASGDSVLVRVHTIGANAVNNLVEQRTLSIWFRHEKGQEAMWIGDDPNAAVVGTAPISAESQC